MNLSPLINVPSDPENNELEEESPPKNAPLSPIQNTRRLRQVNLMFIPLATLLSSCIHVVFYNENLYLDLCLYHVISLVIPCLTIVLERSAQMGVVHTHVDHVLHYSDY